jgi:cyclic pyranopterin monophosphate synthase
MPRMSFKQVDISEKGVSYREATAWGRIKLRANTIKLIRDGKLEKGDPLSLARLTGILAAKETASLLPLCHPLRIEKTDVQARVDGSAVEVSVTVSAHEKTGVEMEALTAVAIALLNVWDATKAYEKDKGGQYPTTAIQSIRVVRKVKRPIETS